MESKAALWAWVSFAKLWTPKYMKIHGSVLNYNFQNTQEQWQVFVGLFLGIVMIGVFFVKKLTIFYPFFFMIVVIHH